MQHFSYLQTTIVPRSMDRKPHTLSSVSKTDVCVEDRRKDKKGCRF